MRQSTAFAPILLAAVFLSFLGVPGIAAAQHKPETCQVLDPELKEFYYGPCQDGLAHGEGHARGSAQYRGEFKMGRKHGRGVKVWPNGDSYNGQFDEDRKHGRGVYTWGRGRNEGERYDGEYRDDKRHGQGTYRWPNGEIYEGPWASDQMTNPNAPVLLARAEALLRGPYFGLLAGRANVKKACDIAPCDDKGSAYGMLFGYQFSRHFSLEAGFHSFGDSQIGGVNISSSAFELVGVGTLPFGRYAPYLKAGIFKGEMSAPAAQESDVNFAMGAGLQYDMPRHAFRVEYMYYRDMGGPNVGLETGIDRISFGLILKFR